MKKKQLAALLIILLTASSIMAARQFLFSGEAAMKNIEEEPYKAICDAVEEESKELDELIQNAKESDDSADINNNESNLPESGKQASP